jgi:uncharacterized protein (DUF1800 family)
MSVGYYKCASALSNFAKHAASLLCLSFFILSAHAQNPVPALTSASPNGAATLAGPVTLTGTGFVKGAVVLVNGTAVSTTYQSSTSVVGQVSVPVGAANVSVQVENPAPGGGVSNSLVLAAQTISLTATDSDGTNTGTARVGGTVNLVAQATSGQCAQVSWSLQGAGTIAFSGTKYVDGLYTAPATMPANPNVTITAYLSSCPTEKTTYSLTLVNLAPAVTSVSPTQLLSGGTQTITLTGTGFLPGMSVVSGGSSYPATVISSTQATAQVAVAGNATGSLPFQVQNAGAGGAGNTFTETIAPPSIALTAVDQDGTNTGTAELGINVNMAAAVTNSLQTAVNWSVSGGGSITSAGVYTAPAAMPASNAVTITASLASNPAVTASYQLSLLNPAVSLSSPNPAQVAEGATTAVTLTGSGFVPSTSILVNGVAVPTTFQSSTSVVAQVPAAMNVTSVSLQAQNPAPGGGTSASLSLPVQTISLTATNSDGTPNNNTAHVGDTVTLLAQSTTGPCSQVSWSLQGAGNLTFSGTKFVNGSYTAPATMPSNPNVTITAYLTSCPTETVSYSLSLVNIAPVVSSVSPTQLEIGGTQTITLTGTGFLPGMTVVSGSSSYPATVISSTQATAQIPVAANATGSLSLQVQNVGTGGAGSTFSETIAPASIALTAVDQDGTNTGTAELGINVNMTAAVTNSLQTAVNWSVSGGGTITSAGVYTAPLSITGNGAVTITAALASNPAITASYSLTLSNPSIAISSMSPAQVAEGATTAVTLTGSGFVTGTSILVNGTAVPTTFKSTTSVVAQVPAPMGTSSVSLQAQNPSPGGGTSASISLPVQTISLTATDSDGTNTNTARIGGTVSFLEQSTAGPCSQVSWSLQGAGSLTFSGTKYVNGLYTAPTTMPTNPNVTVTAYLASCPTETVSYSFTLVNAAPTITSSVGLPTQLLSGATQPLTITGTGFVPGTLVYFNGAPVSTKIIDIDHIKPSVPVPGNANGSITVQIVVPSPGGGTVNFTEPIAPNSIALTATDSEGVNTGTAKLGENVTMTDVVSGSGQTGVTWSVVGGGTISSAGLYTAPAAMPSSGTVTITAAITSNPGITASYSLTLLNPLPTVKSISPAAAIAGTTTAITLTGTGFTPGTVFSVNGSAVPTTYVSPTSVTVQVAVAAGTTSSLSLVGQNPSPGGGSGPVFSLPTWSIILTATDADGTNTGTARLGVPVNFTTSIVTGSFTSRAWSLQGAGVLKYSGANNSNATYTPPQTMPSNPSVTVVAYMGSNTAVTTSYPITLINPIPVVSSASPSQLLSGGTQTVALVGSGFVPGTVVLFNGQTLPTTYVNYNNATVQVPVPANASGTLSLQVQNPAPGGGAGTTFAETVPTNTITLTATDADGVNTGTAELGVSVTMSAAVAGSEQTAVNWSLSGAGSLSASGVYTAPAALPSNQAVTITAALASDPSITASYSLSIINPTPVILSATPSVVPTGTTTTVTVTGTGFVPGTSLDTNVGSVTSTYQSATTMVAQITVPAGSSGELQLSAENTAPGGGTGPFLVVPISAPISTTEAARVLDETTFGATSALIQHVAQEGITAWLNEQFNTPTTLLPTIPNPEPAWCAGSGMECLQSEWWQTALTGNDQLRQRVAFALSQLFVISNDSVTPQAIPPYQNMLANDAFTNWSTIMNDVALWPAMGLYLNMLNSARAGTGQIANENFARENMQLFNLGMALLNPDGTPMLDSNGNIQPTYTEAQIEAFARVYTGWTYANPDGTAPTSGWNPTPNYNQRMAAVELWHDENPKTLLNGVTLPAGQTAEEDFAQAQANIFNHPNLPPFVCQQLIQHLVSGNPSPAYVSRVAAVFMNNGNNVRGDMQAVLTAIFTDPEARAGDTDPSAPGGHLREPILWAANVMRGLGYVNTDPNNNYFNVYGYLLPMGESAYESLDVFNFFPPSYVIPGTNILSPEFGLENTATVAGRLTLADQFVNNKIPSFNVDLSATSPLGQIAVSSGPTGLVNALNTLFMHGQMDANTSAAIVSEISGITDPAQQVRIATYLVVTSSEYKILH